jgi:outer membrane biosynthesis protein TonB
MQKGILKFVLKKNMQDRNKNRKSSLKDFIRYHVDKMQGKERNAFERELQKDPFAAEASEGFASIAADEGLRDISDLQKQLKQRTVRRQRLIIYRIAASVAVLMVVSSLFILVDRNRSPKQIASNISRTEPAEINEPQPIIEPSVKMDVQEQPERIAEKKRKRANDQQNKTGSAKVVASPEDKRIADYQDLDSVHEIEASPVNQDTITSDPSLAARSEVAAGAYGVKKAEYKQEAVPAGYVPPQPAGGMSDFYKYIRENLQWPDSTFAGQKAVVVMSFLVRINGTVDSIKIIRSPGQPFSDEAIRLLRSGPAWNPAEEDGKPVEDEVRVRVVFK